MNDEPFVGDTSKMWTVSLAENEVGFETKKAAEEFIRYLREYYPRLQFVLCPPIDGESK